MKINSGGWQKWIFIPLTIIMFMVQCKHEPVLKKLTDTTHLPPIPTEDTTICFERDILPLFQTNCSKAGTTKGTSPVCHNQFWKKEGLQLYSYSGIVNGINYKDVMGNITNGFMNSTTGGGAYGNMSTKDIALIQRWIRNGMPNNTAPCPARCDSSIFTYSKAIRPLLDKYCVSGCHQTAHNPGGGYALDSFSGVQTVANNGTFLSSIKWTSAYHMPKGFSSQLDACYIRQVEKWIANGAKRD